MVGMQSSSVTPPQKWLNTVARIIHVTGKLAFKAKVVMADPILTNAWFWIILYKKLALSNSAFDLREKATSVLSKNFIQGKNLLLQIYLRIINNSINYF